MIRILTAKEAPALIKRKAVRLEEAERVVAPILADVRDRGDAALLEYARKFDGFTANTVSIPAKGTLEHKFQKAVEIAAKNIRDYPKSGLPIIRTAAGSVKSCVRLMRWGLTCRRGAIPCPPRC